MLKYFLTALAFCVLIDVSRHERWSADNEECRIAHEFLAHAHDIRIRYEIDAGLRNIAAKAYSNVNKQCYRYPLSLTVMYLALWFVAILLNKVN